MQRKIFDAKKRIFHKYYVKPKQEDFPPAFLFGALKGVEISSWFYHGKNKCGAAKSLPYVKGGGFYKLTAPLTQGRAPCIATRLRVAARDVRLQPQKKEKSDVRFLDITLFNIVGEGFPLPIHQATADVISFS